MENYDTDSEILARYEDFEHEGLMSPKNFCKGVIDAVIYNQDRDVSYNSDYDPEQPFRSSYRKGILFGKLLATKINEVKK